MAREGRGGPGRLEHGTLEVAGVRRGYWLARELSGETLLVVLYGSGMSGRDVATVFSRLAAGGLRPG